MVPRPTPSRSSPSVRRPCSAAGRTGFLVLLALAPGAAGEAQEARPLSAPPEFAIDQWTTDDGLPQSSVNALARSPGGYLWIGTFGGLARFDGTSFVLMERTDSAGRHIDRVLSLAVAHDGALWIGTENGLLRWKDGAYQAYGTAEGLPGREVRGVHVSAAGIVWIATGGGVAWFSGGSFGSFREVEGTPLGTAESFVEGSDGTLWVNASGGRVVVVPAGDPAARGWLEPPVDGPHSMLLEDRAGARWLASAGGTARLGGGSAAGLREYDLRGGSLMVEGPRGGYWLGTINDGATFFRVDGDTAIVDRYSLPDGRLGFRVRSGYVDEDGSVWLGTNANGLLRARRNLFTTYTTDHGLAHDVATAVLADRSGTIWVATNCGGVNALDPDRRTVRIYNPRSSGDPEGDPCVFALAEDSSGTVWQGSYGGGVSAIPVRPDASRRVITGLPDSVVLALFTDREGTLWVGTRTGGLAAVRDGRVRASYTTADGLAHNSVRTVYQTRDGALWVGTLGGLSRFHQGRFTTYTAADGLAAGEVRSIHEDGEGRLWIGTYGGGLIHFRDGVFTGITRADGLADEVVSAILEDGRGYFWMSGNRGIYRVARDDLIAFAEGRIERVHSVLYGRADGLRNPETNGGFQPAGWKDGRGHLWFPTVRGVAVVDPARAATSGDPPVAVIEAVVVDGAARSAEEPLRAGPGHPNLEFRYAAVSLSAPEHVRFRYRLDGFDQDWVEAGRRRVAYYPRVPAGRYRFVVSAANRDGVWGEPVAGRDLRVAPPFWSAWWFRLAGAAALLGLVFVLGRWREARVRRDRAAREEFARRLIESQEHERQRLAGELHDGLGQELLIVRNRALLALRSEGVEIRVREQLGHITDIVTGSLQSIRELAHNLAPHQLDHLGLSSALETMVDAVAETSETDLDATIENIDGLLPVESEINLYRIVQEGLNNVVRHSEAATARVHVRRDVDVVRATIIDRGRGFRVTRDADGRLTAGFGLSGMSERARIIGGTLDVRSAPGEGTRIELSVPVGADAPGRAATAPADGAGR